MDTELEQVSRYLDEALTAFSDGRGDDACSCLRQAAVILDGVTLETLYAEPDAPAAEDEMPEVEMAEAALAAAA